MTYKAGLTNLCHVLAISLLLLTGDLLASDTWQAGVARAKITPQKPMWMAGYGNRDRPSDGKLTDLWAKALVLQDAAGNRGVVVTLDIVGIGRDVAQPICNQLTEQYNLQRKDIALCTSHTHTGPVIGHNLAPMSYWLAPRPQQQLIEQYADILQSTVVDIVGQAIQDLQPCHLAHGLGTASFAVNRRNNARDHVLQRRAAGTLAGPNDHDVPVLAVLGPNQKLKAVLFGYACHATVLNTMQWSGDYPGFAQAELERLYPGCQAMFWAGCGADQNPLPRRTVQLAQFYGRQLAGAVEAVLLTEKLQPIAPQLQTSFAEIELELDTLPTTESLRAAAKSDNRFQRSRAELLLRQIDGGQPLSRTYPYPVGVWKLGSDVRWVVLGGEVVVDYALLLKDQLSTPVWIAAYSNDVMAYIPSRRVLVEGGYEGATSMVYYGLPTTWAPTIQRLITSEVLRQAK